MMASLPETPRLAPRGSSPRARKRGARARMIALGSSVSTTWSRSSSSETLTTRSRASEPPFLRIATAVAVERPMSRPMARGTLVPLLGRHGREPLARVLDRRVVGRERRDHVLVDRAREAVPVGLAVHHGALDELAGAAPLLGRRVRLELLVGARDGGGRSRELGRAGERLREGVEPRVRRPRELGEPE